MKGFVLVFYFCECFLVFEDFSDVVNLFYGIRFNLILVLYEMGRLGRI